MKTLRMGVAAALILSAMAGVSWADRDTVNCPEGTYLVPIDSVSTGTRVASTIGHLIQASRVTCSTTACTAGIYDAAAIGDMANANIAEEPGAAASSSAWTKYEPPLSVQTGIVVSNDGAGNLVALLLYECRPRR